jgi:hypothetical protein
MRKLWITLALSGVLVTPALVRADDHNRRRVITYYDRDARDRHEWNEREERAYRHWLEQERKQQYKAWKRAARRDQREYWRWRHLNPNWQ